MVAIVMVLVEDERRGMSNVLTVPSKILFRSGKERPLVYASGLLGSFTSQSAFEACHQKKGWVSDRQYHIQMDRK